MSKGEIKLPEVNKSSLLQEVTRAYMHSGTPSALLYRLNEGITEFIGECESEEDKKFTQEFLTYMQGLQKYWRQKEEDHYK